MITAEIIYLGFLIFALWAAYSLVRGRKISDINKEIKELKELNEKRGDASKVKKLTLIIFAVSYLVYFLIGYLFKIEFLIPFEFHKNGGSINFVFPILCVITTILIQYIIYTVVKIVKKAS